MSRRDFSVGLLRSLWQDRHGRSKRRTRLTIVHPAIPAALTTNDKFWRAFFGWLAVADHPRPQQNDKGTIRKVSTSTLIIVLTAIAGAGALGIWLEVRWLNR